RSAGDTRPGSGHDARHRFVSARPHRLQDRRPDEDARAPPHGARDRGPCRSALRRRPAPERAMIRRVTSVAALAFGVSLGADANAQCHPPANSHEARLLAFYEAPVAFTMLG